MYIFIEPLLVRVVTIAILVFVAWVIVVFAEGFIEGFLRVHREYKQN